MHYSVTLSFETVGAMHYSVTLSFEIVGAMHHSVKLSFEIVGAMHYSVKLSFETVGAMHHSVKLSFEIVGAMHYSVTLSFETVGAMHHSVKLSFEIVGAMHYSVTLSFEIVGAIHYSVTLSFEIVGAIYYSATRPTTTYYYFLKRKSDNATAKPWYRPNDTEENNRKARKAYESLMTVTLRKPTSENYKNFSEEVKRRAAKMYPNFTYGEQEVNSFVGAFHDAVILYALALNETIEAGGNVSDGLNITRRMWNRTFEGITGNVSIDENGDRNADYSLLDLNPETGTFEVVAEYFGNTKQYTPTEGKKIHWAGGRDGPPPDEPICGFDGSKCPPKKPFPEYGIVIIVLGSILLVVLIVTFFVYRHFKLEAELAEMNWRVRWEDILFGAPTMNYKKQENRQNQNGH
ncbi:atrial natriuretic peptide receptor 1, partial [Biomphalaria glabrata]